ncbi:hypothetical protein GCM10012275_17470 [Longimycelium tulufanense]|uniref:Activator of Hsp90 ATPase homologue 1/2-like C-terminal domain-containing protein n=1 Tax=Longimycelium tulufanense TaxID=907463 RepID=A0A8J3CC32_9PSEU|nr:SRPBCC domain-containing protein [Longimycelium tulufanense]GGM46909.1 hypothetical protein GCM10012275_17470 [Longimycelium tulufanense]
MSTTRSIRFQEFFPHPVERVWAALTEPSAIAKWLMDNDFVPEVGRTFTLRAERVPFRPDGTIPCRVVECDPPTTLAYTWASDSWIVCYRLEPAEVDGVAGTRLHFEHSGFDLDNPRDAFAYDKMGRGWRSMGPDLARVLDELAASSA